MSNETNPELVERMLRPLHKALRDPDALIGGLQALNCHITNTEKLEIPGAAKRQLIDTLRRQRRAVEQAWLASVGAELKAQAKELGLLITVKVAQRRAPKNVKPAAPKAGPVRGAETGTETLRGEL